MRTRWFRRDEGFTMLAVLASAVLVMGLVLAGIAFAVAAHRATRASQDDKGALSAAQAGLQDYIHRLNACEDYYRFPANACTGATPNPGIRLQATDTNVALVPGTAGTERSEYSQRVLNDPSKSTGLLRVEIIGQVRNTVTDTIRERRSLVVDLSRKGFLNFLYYTDFETFSPANTRLTKPVQYHTPSSNQNVTANGTGVTYTLQQGKTYTIAQPTLDQVTRGCARYYYATKNGAQTVPGRSTFPRTLTGPGLPSTGIEYWPTTASNAGGITSYQCLTINFSGTDTFDGDVHSNDAMSISGPVVFKKKVTTNWKTTGNTWYGSSNPSPSGNTPKYSEYLPLPATTDKQADAAAQNGCVYTGPTSIEFLADGRMRVRSPLTLGGSVRPGCSAVAGVTPMTQEQVVNGPANGVVYVQKATGAGSCLSFQNDPNDVTNYDNAGCTRGDAFVRGTVKGRFTVAAEHDVVVTGNVRYNSGTTGTDALGLVGTNNVAVWHPVTSAGVNINPPADLEINAAIASTGNSFTVFNYGQGSKLGTLTVKGVIIQRYRGPVATGSGTTTTSGYGKNYVFDNRLVSVPPPVFVEPVLNSWDINSISTQR
ncbi:hypothetical protein GCM10027586_01380 [Kineococcus gypseus]